MLERIHRARGSIGLYFEIGVRQGRSLSLSRADTSIGVDPDFNLTWPFSSPTRLFKTTSDAFFAQYAPTVLTRPIDLAFIDGMHLAEFALRDFINVERHCTRDSWVIIDDVLPCAAEIASRTRTTSAWTGDVYKITSVLRAYRPDLSVTVFDVDTKGLMLIRNLDPDSSVLADNLARLEADFMAVDAPILTVQQIRDIAAPVAPEEFGTAS